MSLTHPSPQSHPNSPQVNIAPPPPCMHDIPTYHKQQLQSIQCRNFLILLFNMVHKLYHGPQFPNRYPKTKIKKTVCHIVYNTQHIAELNYKLSL